MTYFPHLKLRFECPTPHLVYTFSQIPPLATGDLQENIGLHTMIIPYMTWNKLYRLPEQDILCCKRCKNNLLRSEPILIHLRQLNN